MVSCQLPVASCQLFICLLLVIGYWLRVVSCCLIGYFLISYFPFCLLPDLDAQVFQNLADAGGGDFLADELSDTG